MSNDPPVRHHYIPRFYLNRWNNNETKVGQIGLGYKGLQTKLVSSKSTGFENHLYSQIGFESDEAQFFEKNFFSKEIDDPAAKVLQKLEKTADIKGILDEADRTSWSHFLISLLLRCPEDIATFREWWPFEFDSVLSSTARDIASFEGYGNVLAIKNELSGAYGKYSDTRLFKALVSMIKSQKITNTLTNMHWCVFHLDDSIVDDFLTSDRPIIRNGNIGDRAGHIALPIGPRRLFVATKEIDYLHQIKSVPLKQLVRISNRLVVGGAVKFVYRRVDSEQEDTLFKNFVNKHFGKAVETRLIENVVNSRRGGLWT